MATKPSTADFILDQLEALGDVRVRRMFGEYALYFGEKVVGLICDDTLFVKITDPGKALLRKEYREGAPYPGAKPYMEIGDTVLEDRERLCELIRVTAETLPKPKPKKKP